MELIKNLGVEKGKNFFNPPKKTFLKNGIVSNNLH